MAKFKVIKNRPNTIFVSTGRGVSSDSVAISVHKSYSEYAEYMQEVREDWAEYMTSTGSFLIALNGDDVLRPISLKNIADCLEKEKSGARRKA